MSARLLIVVALVVVVLGVLLGTAAYHGLAANRSVASLAGDWSNSPTCGSHDAIDLAVKADGSFRANGYGLSGGGRIAEAGNNRFAATFNQGSSLFDNERTWNLELHVAGLLLFVNDPQNYYRCGPLRRQCTPDLDPSC